MQVYSWRLRVIFCVDLSGPKTKMSRCLRVNRLTMEVSRRSIEREQARREAIVIGQETSDLKEIINRYASPDTKKAMLQVLDTFLPYAALWGGMLWLVMAGYPYWITLLVAIPAALLLVRIFIIFHDCGHRSFFRSRSANRVMGTICGILTFTPFEDWTRAHAIHHGAAGNLDRRGIGDVWTMTVTEYVRAPWWKRALYRVFRNPVFLLLIAPGFLFLAIQRLPTKGAGPRERTSVWLTNLLILLLLIAAHYTIGIKAFILVQLPIILIAASSGIWLFYVQHQFKDVYWAAETDRDPVKVALEGSSYYKLPRVLQWFSGNIGFHHIHHLNSRVPNHRLQACCESLPPLENVRLITLRKSLESLRLRLWNEASRQMISFRELRLLKRAAA